MESLWKTWQWGVNPESARWSLKTQHGNYKCKRSEVTYGSFKINPRKGSENFWSHDNMLAKPTDDINCLTKLKWQMLIAIIPTKAIVIWAVACTPIVKTSSNEQNERLKLATAFRDQTRIIQQYHWALLMFNKMHINRRSKRLVHNRLKINKGSKSYDSCNLWVSKLMTWSHS